MKKNLYMAITAIILVFVGCEPKQEVDTPTYKPLNGIFSISHTQKVRFSQGNLQYTRSTNRWSFATHQYDFIGTDNVIGGIVAEDEHGIKYREGNDLADKIDLFGWSGSTGVAKWGVSTSAAEYHEYGSDYSGDFADWGLNIGDGNTWRTLAGEEWDYLVLGRDNADSLISLARIVLSNTEYADGLILLPDNWTCPSDINIKKGSSATDDAEFQTFTLDEWQKLETAGAVFLPAAGVREGSLVWKEHCCGAYWASSLAGDKYYWMHGENRMLFPEFFSFEDSGCDQTTADMSWPRSCGLSVRLVQDL